MAHLKFCQEKGQPKKCYLIKLCDYYLNLMLHIFKNRIKKAKGGKSLWVQGQPGLHSSRKARAMQRNPGVRGGGLGEKSTPMQSDWSLSVAAKQEFQPNSHHLLYGSGCISEEGADWNLARTQRMKSCESPSSINWYSSCGWGLRTAVAYSGPCQQSVDLLQNYCYW